MADIIKGEMIRGHIDTVILLALTDSDKDSNEIRISIEEKSDNQYSVKQGTFYSAMQRLVKQGYIKEYRSSAVDGIRRKYYSLNPKGKTFLEKNREQWQASKNLVDNLMENDTSSTTQQVSSKIVINEENRVDEFETFKNLASDIGNFKIDTSLIEDDSYFENIGNEVLNELNLELEKIENESNEEQSLTQNQDLIDQTSNLENKPITTIESISESDNETIETYESISNKTKSDLYDFEITEDDEESQKLINQTIKQFEEIPKEKNIEINHSPENLNSETITQTEVVTDNAKLIETTNVNTINKFKTTAFSQNTNEKNDLLIVEEGKPINRREYKQILNRLFPQNDEKPAEKIEIVENQVILEKNIEQQKNNEPNYIDREEQSFTEQKKVIVGDPSDFSDLYEMAKREGFKIKTSHNTNRYTGNEILINKLRLHSSLIFYIILLIECLVLNFALAPILRWTAEIKLIILAGLSAFPVVSALIYFINSKRSVYDVSPFKDSISIALIVTFQLAIIILCVALFVSVDFNNFKEVTTYILLPLILAMNIPLYFILKYTLLSSGKYFTD